MEGELVNNPNPDLEDLNRKGIKKLYDVLDSIDAKSEPELIRATIESVAKLNSSLRNNDIFAPKESAEERAIKEKTKLVEGMLKSV